MLQVINSLRFITGHPLNRNQKIRAISRFLFWQIKTRLTHDPVIIPFINNSRLLVRRGMTGATGNIYCGLHEFEEMAFLLHFLRADDLFIDVGANVGSYTVLASAVIGSRCIAIEPIPTTFKYLTENVCLNVVSDKVTALNIGIASQQGNLRFTSGLDTTNHVVSQEEKLACGTVEVSTDTLNNLVGHLDPVLIKMDVEGFEANVIEGADQVLQKDSPLALILERTDEHNRYGYDGNHLRQHLCDYGFTPYRYDPFKRVLITSDQNVTTSQNILYLKGKNLTHIQKRVFTAAPFFVKRIRKEGI
jgi:FkbM family methyltransferase